jgi:hypothetical protein
MTDVTIVKDVNYRERDRMCPNSPLEPDEKDDQRVELNAGIFVWPVIIVVCLIIGLFFGYLLLQHWPV